MRENCFRYFMMRKKGGVRGPAVGPLLSADQDAGQVFVILGDGAVVLLTAFAVVHPLEHLLDLGRLVIDKGAGVVRKDGADLELTQREFDLLTYLATNAGNVFSRQELMERVWNYEGYVGDVRAVDVAIRRLREKVEDNPAQPRYIITRRGAGYLFQKDA